MNALILGPGDLHNYKEGYQEQGCVQISSCLEPSVLKLLLSSFDQGFEKRFILDNESSEFSLTNPLLKYKLDVIFNDPEFLKLMSLLTGGLIRFTKQRLYYIDSSCTSLPWHDDSYDKDGRVAAIRFELSDSYEGGDFLFKDEKSSHTFKNLQSGDAVLFKIEYEKCFHMVSPVLEGTRRSLIVFLCE